MKLVTLTIKMSSSIEINFRYETLLHESQVDKNEPSAFVI